MITGAGAGIGRGCALAYAQEGAAVAVLDIDAHAAEETAEAVLAADGQAIFIPADIADAQAARAAIAQAASQWGHIDILVCSAGIGGRKLGDGPAHLCAPEAWEQVLHVNLGGTFLACKYALPFMMAQHSGSIITLSSVLGVVGTQGLFDTHAYAASKAGIIGLTRSIAAHYARDHIRANAIAPGLIDTRMANRAKSDPALLEQVAFWQPLGPLGRIEDVVSAAVFLGSDDSAFITGAVLPVDGGWTAQ